jgi:hypothetical protein
MSLVVIGDSGFSLSQSKEVSEAEARVRDLCCWSSQFFPGPQQPSVLAVKHGESSKRGTCKIQKTPLE